MKPYAWGRLSFGILRVNSGKKAGDYKKRYADSEGRISYIKGRPVPVIDKNINKINDFADSDAVY